MRPTIQRNDAGFVNHLVADHEVARSLHDFDAVVVEKRQHRTNGAQCQAAVPVGQVLPRIRSFLLCLVAGQTLALPFLRFWCQRGNPAVGWIDDERGLPAPLAWLKPGGANRHAVWAAGGFDGSVRLHLAEPLRVFLVVENRSGPHLRVPLDGSLEHVCARPDSLKVRIAPWSSGWRPCRRCRLRRGQRGYHRNCEHTHQREK